MVLRTGTNGRDIFVAINGDDDFNGLLGFDSVSYNSAKQFVTIDLNNGALNAGWAFGDTFVSIESFKLTAFNDYFFGNGLDNEAYAGFGNDYLNGRAGNDTLYGENGNDTIYGDTGNDKIYGSQGFDIMYGGADNDFIAGFTENDTAYGDAGNDSIFGGAGVDTLYGGTGNDTMYGDAGIDYMYGGDENDTMYGGTENDIVSGQNGNDKLYGEAGNDTMDGGADNDTVNGGLGNDTLYGGTGNDTILGDAGDDYLSGSDGNDVLTGGKDLGSFTTSVAGTPPVVSITGVTYGDEFFGGNGSDRFVFNAGDGVDAIGDFVVGTDTIDINNNWFDGDLADGEWMAIDAGGSNTFIVFTDNGATADGLMDNTAIYLQGVAFATVTSAIFV